MVMFVGAWWVGLDLGLGTRDLGFLAPGCGIFFRGFQWFLYYGCADSFVAVAVAPAEKP